MWMLSLLLCPSLAGEDFAGQGYFLGELHSHTGASGDGGSSDLGDCSVDCAAVGDLAATARAAGLDFVAVTDHVNGPATATAQDFSQVWNRLLGDHDPAGGLVTIPGAELWLRWPDGSAIGHKDLLLFGEDAAALAGFRLVNAQPNGDDSLTIADCEDLWAWMASVEAAFGAALLLPHHPALSVPMETDWGCHDSRWSPAVEVYSKHGNSLAAPATFDDPWSPMVPESTVEAALDQGLALGFVGGTDAHDTRPGSVCTLDPEAPDHPYGGGLTVAVLPGGEPLDRTGLHRAITEHRTYITTGPLVPVDVDWRVEGVSQGGHGAAPQVAVDGVLEGVITLPVGWAASVQSVRLRGSDVWWAADPAGEGVWSVSVPATELSAWVYVDVTLAGTQPGDCDDGGDDALEHLWLSPIWPGVLPADTGGETGTPGDSSSGPTDSAPTTVDSGGEPEGRCGCGVAPVGTGLLWGLGVLALGWRRRAAQAA